MVAAVVERGFPRLRGVNLIAVDEWRQVAPEAKNIQGSVAVNWMRPSGCVAGTPTTS